MYRKPNTKEYGIGGSLRNVPGCYGFRYMAYSIHSGKKTEHIIGLDGFTSMEKAKAHFHGLLSKWNSQAYGSIQFWEEK